MFDVQFGFCNKGSYSGIGSRRIPLFYTKQQMKFAAAMVFMGVKLRSGAADGSDTAFEFGAKLAYDFLANFHNLPKGDYGRVMDIYLPWSGFNGRDKGSGYIDTVHPQAEAFTKKYHNYWEGLKVGAKKMMSRNAMQVLGTDLQEKARFIMCYTPCGSITNRETSSKSGGTGQAIRIGDDLKINVYNIGRPEHFLKVENWISEIEIKIEEKYGVNLSRLVDMGLSARSPGEARSGDLVKSTLNGEHDIIIHGCNCQNTMGSGLAKQIRMAFPEAYNADLATRKGDKRKLGTYSFAKVQRNNHPITIINAYTQDRWGRDEQKLYSDYEAIRNVMKSINEDFPSGRIVVPNLGAGLANGCWATIANSLDTAFKGRQLTHMTLNNELALQAEPNTQQQLF